MASLRTAFAQGFTKFVDSSPTAFHAVEETRRRLIEAGYVPLKEKESWTLAQGGRYFFTRNQSTIVAFAVGAKFVPGNGFSIVGAHTDSPHLKLKPKSNAKEKIGYLSLGVECYGGGIWHTWFDRDLTVAGRVLLDVESEGVTSVVQRLVHIQRPICRIPSLAIHLDRTVNDGFAPNKEDHIRPIIATQLKSSLESFTSTGAGNHSPALLAAIAAELQCSPEDIRDFELGVVDCQPATIGGLFNEFVYSSRIDNLLSCYVALDGFLAADTEASLGDEENVRAIAFFDHEEIGSNSAQGAASSLMMTTIQRINATVVVEKAPAQDALETSLARSYFISMDMAHAVHPWYSGKHEENHQPQIHKGVVIKTNQSMRYATNCQTAFIFRQIARRVGADVQEFVVRNDAMCGSTIGPIIASSCGMRTIDVGIPQLSMHSIREMCGADDMFSARDIVVGFFQLFRSIDDGLIVD